MIVGWFAVVAIAGAGAFALAWQHHQQIRLDRQVAELRHRNDDLARRGDESARLAATTPSAVEMDRLRPARAELPRLRAEIAGLQTQARAAAEEANRAAWFEAGSKVHSTEWKKAGTATPKATLETALWAAAGGDVDEFAHCLSVSEGSVRQQALALIQTLPADLRERYGTPERLVAFLAIRDVPLGSAEIVSWDRTQGTSPTERVRVRLSEPTGQTKDVMLRFTQDGADWKLVVPSVMQRYAAMLKAPLTSSVGASR